MTISLSDSQTTIATLPELIQELDEAEEQEYGRILSDLDCEAIGWDDYSIYASDKYARVCLKECPEYELLLLCWEPGQETPIHGHDDQKCWVRIVEGTFSEILYDFDESSGEMKFLKKGKPGKGEMTYMQDSMGYHSLKNDSSLRALSLHLYAKPILSCEVYDEDNNELEIKEMHYDRKLKV